LRGATLAASFTSALTAFPPPFLKPEKSSAFQHLKEIHKRPALTGFIRIRRIIAQLPVAAAWTLFMRCSRRIRRGLRPRASLGEYKANIDSWLT
jgi:hypothetical protein